MIWKTLIVTTTRRATVKRSVDSTATSSTVTIEVPDDDLPKTFAPELTFVPRWYPHEIPHDAVDEANRLIDRINNALGVPGVNNLGLWAKLDPFHNPHDDEKRSYCVEIVPSKHWPISYLEDERSFNWLINIVFRGMRKAGYVPCARKRVKGILTEYPTGGCHIHYGAALFKADTAFYRNMEALHWLVIYEQVNNPWHRWVFAQWFNDAGHHTVYNPVIWNPYLHASDWKSKDEFVPTPEFLFQRSTHAYAVEPRFMPTAKGSWVTWEWRIFRMVENATELVKIVRFVDAYMAHLVKRVHGGEGRDTCQLRMNLREWGNLSKPGVVRRKFQNLLDILNLSWQDYAMFYERNFETRLKWGKLV